MFNTDAGGVATKAEIKLCDPASTWATRLSQIGKGNGRLIICTGELLEDKSGGNRYLRKIFDKRDAVDPGLGNTTLIVNNRDKEKAEELLNDYPDMAVILTKQIKGDSGSC